MEANQKPPVALWAQTVSQSWGVAFVAVFSYATAHYVFRLGQSYWAPISAVVVLYPDAVATRRASVDRFFGTFIGCVVGWAGASLFHHRAALDVLIYGAAIFLGVGICWLLRLTNASRLCAVAITVIVLIPRDASPAHVALWRFFEVSYGALCALGYSVAAAWLAARWQRRIFPGQESG